MKLPGSVLRVMVRGMERGKVYRIILMGNNVCKC